TVLRGAGDNGANKAIQQARSSRLRQGVNKRLVVVALFSSEKPVYSTFWFPTPPVNEEFTGAVRCNG
ncbi:MAG: hypothetical protein ABIJ50_10055, partial [Pseudomonadota bacterium]